MGTLIAFSLYPAAVRGIHLLLFTLLPAGFVGYVPARLAQHPSFVQVLLLAAVAGTYLLIAVAVFDRGLKRYSSGSRFGVFG